MKLTKLTLDGFKSFGYRTEINFDDGVTVVVGPNGCGKSNVVDAIKWVLGERSIKSLRSEEMLDVIFNGASGAKPSGYAEVSLSFANADESKKLPLDYDEITVARRLHRSGESEYLLNSQTCRLKDIRELFLGTGIGMESYSIIEQGKVDFILRSNPVERRELLDEAAGISKYKSKKRESESKLQKVEQDLIRLQDILREVRREIRSIKIQATKAEKYKNTLEELKTKKTQLALKVYYQYQQKHTELSGKLLALRNERDAFDKELQKTEEVIISIDKDILKLDDEVSVYQEKLIELSGQISETRSGIETSTLRRQELIAEEEQTRKNIEVYVQKTIELRNRLCEAIKAFEVISRESDLLNCELTEKDEVYKGISGQLNSTIEEIESIRGDIFQSTHKKSSYQNEMAAVQNELKNLSAKREKFAGKHKEFTDEAGILQEKQLKLNDSCAGMKQTMSNLKQDVVEREITIKALESDLITITEECSRLKEEISRIESRKEVLNDLERHHEGCSKGVRTVLDGELSLPVNMLGLVADVIVINPKYVNAAEVALKGFSDALLVNGHEDALQIVKFVRDLQKGRITVIALERLKRFSLRPPLVTASFPGIIGYADEIIEDINLSNIDAETKTALKRALLGRYLLVDSIETARNILNEHLYDGNILTVNGEVITSEGAVTGGSIESGTGLISRKTELRFLDDTLFALSARLTNIEQMQANKTSEIENARTNAQNIRNMVYDQAVQITDMEKDIAELNRRHSLVSKEIEITDMETADVEQQINSLSERVVSTVEIIKELESGLQQAQAQIEQLNSTVNELSQKKQQLEATITEMKVSQAKLLAEKSHLTQQLIHTDNDLMQLEITLETSVKLLSDTKGRIVDLHSKIEADNLLLSDITAKQQEVQNQLSVLKESIRKLKDDFAGQKQAEDRIHNKMENVQEELNTVIVEEKEYSLKIENICEKHKEENGTDLRELMATYQPPAENSPDSGDDWQKVSDSIDELRRRLGEMTDVNLSAIDQLKSLEERNDFLSAQEQDLIKSKESLQDFIRKTNRECRERFESTFELVHENFNQLFRKLFGGGKAELILEKFEKEDVENTGHLLLSESEDSQNTEGSAEGSEEQADVIQSGKRYDILESGIEIIAKPPGKEPTSISLLSGGEKTLTALALVMAIFKLQPSPFCILDEADSTLDENNIDRFCGLVRDFAGETQFIVITHNKKTMLVGDVLYGMTMPTPGISRKISVKMDEVDKLLEEDSKTSGKLQGTAPVAVANN